MGRAEEGLARLRDARTPEEWLEGAKTVSREMDRVALGLIEEGRALGKLGRRQEAIAKLDQALRLAPDSEDARLAAEGTRAEIDGQVV